MHKLWIYVVVLAMLGMVGAIGCNSTQLARPTLVFARAGNTQAIVTWQAPGGSSPITEYVVTSHSSSGNPVTTTTTPSVLVATVIGLTNNQSYTFTVNAKNGGFIGPASDPSNAVTPTTWTRQFGTGAMDKAHSVSSDSSDNTGVYVVGNTFGTLSGPTVSTDSDAFLSKYSPSGTLNTPPWPIQFGFGLDDAATGVSASPSDQSVYVVGYTISALTSTSSGGVDAFLSKYDAKGTPLWPMIPFGTSKYDHATGVSADLKGNAFVVGHTTGRFPNQASLGDGDAFLSKYNASGAPLWPTIQFGTSGNDWTSGVSADSLGNVYVVGYTTGAFPPPQTNSGAVDAFLSKYNASGAPLWPTIQFGTSGNDLAYDVSADSFGNVYVVGYTDGAFPLPQTNSGGYDAFLSKFDASGNHVWTRQFGTALMDLALGISADNFGNIYVVGQTGGSFLGPKSAMDSDAFLRMYDAAGNAIWTRQFDSVQSGLDEAGTSVSADNFGNVYVAGWTTGALPGQTSSGDIDAFLLK